MNNDTDAHRDAPVGVLASRASVYAYSACVGDARRTSRNASKRGYMKLISHWFPPPLASAYDGLRMTIQATRTSVKSAMLTIRTARVIVVVDGGVGVMIPNTARGEE
jgi:hypothetical protein